MGPYNLLVTFHGGLEGLAETEVRARLQEAGAGIGPNDRWMLVPRKRRTNVHTMDLVKLLTDPIDRDKVDLKHPDKLLVVEIMGEETGMNPVTAEQLLDVNRVREEIE